MSFKYLLIQTSEDGEPNTFYTEDAILEYLNPKFEDERESVAKMHFLSEEEMKALDYGGSEMYWKGNKRLLLKIEFIVPKPQDIKTKWVLK